MGQDRVRGYGVSGRQAIGGFAAALKGQVDGIVLTGGVSNDKYFTNYISERVSWIAPIKIYGGDFEMEGCAAGACVR